MSAVSVEAICVAAQQVLEAGLPAALALQGDDLENVDVWAQLPTRESLSTAALPAGAVTSPGLAGAPIRDEDGSYQATWVLAVAIYARGADYADTTRRIRAYAAAVRDVLVAAPTLTGVAIGVRWTHEEYALLSPNSARTEGGCLVEFEVDVQRAFSFPASSVPVAEITGQFGLLPVHPAI